MMDADDAAEREWRRQRFLRNLPWLIPVGSVIGVGAFIGLGFLLVWLWRVTLVDIFGIKEITFWQAWGLILLSQFLFKTHITGRAGTGRYWQHGRHGSRGRGIGTEPPQGPDA